MEPIKQARRFWEKGVCNLLYKLLTASEFGNHISCNQRQVIDGITLTEYCKIREAITIKLHITIVFLFDTLKYWKGVLVPLDSK